jgi:hypothetical protein
MPRELAERLSAREIRDRVNLEAVDGAIERQRYKDTLIPLAPFHCVLTATLVAPLVTPPPSLNRTTMRLLAGSNGTFPLPCKKIANVGVCPALI